MQVRTAAAAALAAAAVRAKLMADAEEREILVLTSQAIDLQVRRQYSTAVQYHAVQPRPSDVCAHTSRASPVHLPLHPPDPFPKQGRVPSITATLMQVPLP